MLNMSSQKLGRDSPFLRLAGAKWGCGRVTFSITYKTYVQPVLNYCNEVLVSALGMLEDALSWECLMFSKTRPYA
ncbi:hypothetical protein TNCT_609071 [Trichonephila clavata]|uniref:Uncharacterized protein n=1 Tax=Trichonephila clavata TaxID=2740835 RepID=A0A8X6GRP6_TRICU|nr:hypothetical protein TNCT_609071 [Trichonephila clavata]